MEEEGYSGAGQLDKCKKGLGSEGPLVSTTGRARLGGGRWDAGRGGREGDSGCPSTRSLSKPVPSPGGS